jgi:inorganic pyrophosphatase
MLLSKHPAAAGRNSITTRSSRQSRYRSHFLPDSLTDGGFVPSTKADDGDPIDFMVAHDATTFPGIVLTCRVIGILQIEQKGKGEVERNDRLFAVPRDSHSEQALTDVRDLSEPIQQELEKFFKAIDELEDEKLNIVGWKGPKAAVEAIKDAAKNFKKNGKQYLRPYAASSTPSVGLPWKVGRAAGLGKQLLRASGSALAAQFASAFASSEALRQIAFYERRKIHDLLMEGVELALKKRIRNASPAASCSRRSSCPVYVRTIVERPQRFDGRPNVRPLLAVQAARSCSARPLPARRLRTTRGDTGANPLEGLEGDSVAPDLFLKRGRLAAAYRNFFETIEGAS